MDFFVENPKGVVLVAGAFLLAFGVVTLMERYYRKLRSWPLLGAAVLWGLYALWEWYCQGKGWNIRIDLLLIYPGLFLASLGACLLIWRWKWPPN
jgi:hypothetical protein